MKMFLVFLLLSFTAVSCSSPQLTTDNMSSKSADDPDYRVVLLSEVEWEQLNPARGENSPKAATLWGDRTGPGPSGFLLKPVDGFKSPPHIHTANYHGVVIKGSIHNADPNAEEVYLAPGSFWTQPGGGVHITAAKGSALAYIEVEDTFDVLPAENAADKVAEPVVIQASEIDWVDPQGLRPPNDARKIAPLWNDDIDSGSLYKIPSGSDELLMRGSDSTIHIVLVQGQLRHQILGNTDYQILEPGSYFGSEGNTTHGIKCEEGEDCIIYLRRDYKFGLVPDRPKD